VKPLISFIVPVYNREKLLKDCMESLLEFSQDYCEIILIDDASTDGSRELIQKYEKQTKNVKKCLLEKNRGPGNARNCGLQCASGEFVAFVDSDDRIDALKFYEMLLNMKKQQTVEICMFNHDLLYTNGTSRIVQTVKEERKYEKEEFFRNFPYILTAPICSYVFRKSFLDKFQLQFPEQFYIEDASFATKALLHAESIFTYPEVLYHYRYISDNSLVMTGDAKKKLDGIDSFLMQLVSYDKEGAVKRPIEYAIFSMCVRSIAELVQTNFFEQSFLSVDFTPFRVNKQLFSEAQDVKKVFFENLIAEIKRISNGFSKKIVLCPTGKYALLLGDLLKKKFGCDVAFYDNHLSSPYLKEAEKQGYLTDCLKNLKFINNEEFCVVIFHTSFVCYDIIKQIEQYGLEYDKDFVCGLNTD